jgi:hypothetical protein
MNVNRKIDFSKLLGFQVLGEELSERVDFQDETFGGRLGAKVGDKTCSLLDLPPESDSTHH